MATTDRAPLSEYIARRDNGTVIAAGSVRVLLPGTSTEATVFSAQTGAGTLTQPLVTDSRGRVPGWVEGRSDGYDIEVTADGTTYPVQRVRPGTPNKLSNLAVIPSARIRRTTTQSIANSSQTKVIFNTELFDTDNIADIAGANDRLVIQTAGVYMLTAAAEWASNFTGYRDLEIHLNGATSPVLASGRHAGQGSGVNSVTTFARLSVSDFLTMHVLQTSGAALNVGLVDSAHTELGALWLAPL